MLPPVCGAYRGLMDVVFTRTGERRYGLTILAPGAPLRGADPAPGYDDYIPHDLVHYVIEAELKMSGGLYGRAAAGGGCFLLLEETPQRRGRRRRQRQLQRREAHLREKDHAGSADMARSERLAALCDMAWRLRRSPKGQPPPWVPKQEISAEDREAVERVVARLDEIAPLWNSLKIGESLTFTWPNPLPVQAAHR